MTNSRAWSRTGSWVRKKKNVIKDIIKSTDKIVILLFIDVLPFPMIFFSQ